MLEVASRAGLEAANRFLQAVFDRRVVTDVEVQEADLLEGAPVAAIEYVALANIERAGDDVASAPSEHQAKTVLPATSQQIEERGIQIPTAPIKLVNGRPVEAEHQRQELVG